MNKFKFKSIVIIYFIPFAFFISQGCRTLKNNTEDVPSCAGSTASIWVSGVLEETAQIGTINIPIGYQICSEYRGGWITLFIVRPGGDGISSMKWDIPTDNPSTGTQYFEYKFIAIGEYEIYAELHPNNNQSGKMPIRTSLSFFINITASPNRIVYPIIQLETRAWRPIGYQVQELWPKRFDANNNQVYFGQFKRDSVFNSANVSFSVVRTLTGIEEPGWGSNPPKTTPTEWYIWAVTESNNGDYNNAPSTTIICAVKDMPLTVLPSYALGYAEPRIGTAPAVAFVLGDRISALPDFSSWEKTFIKVGAAIHELGHTTGISGDDATSNVPGNHITPPHEGENSTNCLMRSPSTQDTYPLIPKLCTRHNDYIRNESWIRNP